MPHRSSSSFTPGRDFIRGTGASEFLSARPLTAQEQTLFNDFVAMGFSRAEVYAAIYMAFGGFQNFGGSDRIFSGGGDDIIIDLLGDNLIVSEDGDDEIYLGSGNDRVYDDGGDNFIEDLGGNNLINTGDGNDTILTGDGDDNINAFDGRNFINAGGGNNLARGGDGYDEIVVGTGQDFVEVRGGFSGEDLNGNGVLDPGEDRDFDGVLDLPDEEFFAFLNLGLGFVANNYAVDLGGDDTIRATASAGDQGDDVVLSDVIVTFDVRDANLPGFRSIIIEPGVFGDDLIEMGAGDNLIIDGGGNNIVRTLSGSDIVFTSFFQAGNDQIDTGSGDDTINPGSGVDRVRGGIGNDTIILEFDGQADTLVYGEGDVNPNSFDTVDGLDGNGVDKFDLRGLGAVFDDLLLDVINQGVIALDNNANDVFDPNVDDIVALINTISGPFTLDNLIFADMV